LDLTGDTVLQWYSGIVIQGQWYSDIVIQWYSDTVIQIQWTNSDAGCIISACQ